MKTVWVVRQMDNLTAYDDFHEDTFEGPTNVERDRYEFETEDEAIDFYRRQKAMLKVAGTRGMYYTYPVQEEK